MPSQLGAPPVPLALLLVAVLAAALPGSWLHAAKRKQDTEKLTNPIRRGRMGSFEEASGSTTERRRFGGDRDAAAISAPRRTRAGEVGRWPRGFASERLPGELDVDTRR